MNTQAKSSRYEQLSTIQERFLFVNDQRLQRIQNSLSSKQKNFIDFLPLFFQFNHPNLPGYVSKNTPNGIFAYSNDEAANKTAKRLFRLLDKDFRTPATLAIEAIYLMGSSGTIAYTEDSDFDIWILHKDDLSAEAIDELVSKSIKIEEWCNTLDLEVHFFIFSVEQFKRGELHSLSNESSGSTQFYLLLDEFYRSSVLISGKKPAWWLVPPEANDSQHEQFIHSLSESNELNTDEFIDFGSLSNAPINEFFTASIWQLYKSIQSPYKSLLKLLLIERYAREYPKINFLSRRYKQAIYTNKTEIYDIDPYLILYYKIEDFLLDTGQGNLLELVRKCLYIKVNEKLSSSCPSNSRWRYNTIKKLTEHWNWNNEKFRHIDNIQEWTLEDVEHIRKRIINALITSHRFLSDFARQHNEKISFEKNELNILGRRLFSAFERKNNKIDIINHGLAPNIFENKISLLDIKAKKKEYQWLLFRDTVKPEDINSHSVLKQNKHLMELISWLHFNNIVTYNSRILISNRYHDIDILNLDKVLHSLNEIFPKVVKDTHKNELSDFNQPQRLKQAAIYINIALPSSIKILDQENFLSSNRDDVFSYGGQHKNLASSIDLIIETTWQEVLHYRYEGFSGIAECICIYLNWFPLKNHFRPSVPPVFCYFSHYNKIIVKRFELLFESIFEAFYLESENILIKYVFEIENHYIVIFNNNDHYNFIILDDYQKLKDHLSQPNKTFTKTFFDPKSFWPDNYPSLFQYNKPDSIQVFYFVKNNIATIHVLDEKGSYFMQEVDFASRDLLIHHYQLFITSTIQRRKFLLEHELNSKHDYTLEFYNIHRKPHNEYVFHKCKQLYGKHESFYLPVQVIGKLDNDSNHSLSIFCRDIEFSSYNNTDVFNKAAEYILQQREQHEKYPIYITDIDILDTLAIDTHQSLQTTHFLRYKKRIENKLNQSLKELK